MSKAFFFFALLWFPVNVVAQTPHLLTDSVSAQVVNYEVLPDKGYSVQQVISDTTLHFTANDSLYPQKEKTYWIKIKINNPSSYAKQCNIWQRPFLNNILYYYHTDKRKWIAHETGILKRPAYDSRGRTLMPCVLRAQTVNTLFIKTDLSLLGDADLVIKPKIEIERADAHEQAEWILSTAWVASMIVLFLFFLNNLYVYFSFRDRTVLYYLIAQLGGMIYITSYREFFSVLFYCPVFTFRMFPNGWALYFNLNFLLMYISLLFIMYGFVQFTRSYLATAKNLPTQDKWLKWGLLFYLSVTAIIAFISTTVVCLMGRTTVAENMMALFLIGVILHTAIVGYRRKLHSAGPFLFANILPLIFMSGTALFHVFVSHSYTVDMFLPDFAMISQAFGFSVALVARTRRLQADLNEKRLEAHQLEFDLREIKLRQRFVELENEKINGDIQHQKTINELLRQKLEANQRELTSAALYTVQKNKMLANLKMQIQELEQLYPGARHDELRNIRSSLTSNLYLDADWQKFKLHFEQVHPDFFENLRTNHPSLTINEIRLYAYFHINLSTKEIAAMLNIDPASVRRAKTRLYKKMALPESGNFSPSVNQD